MWVPQGSLTLSQRYSIGRRNDELTKKWSAFLRDCMESYMFPKESPVVALRVHSTIHCSHQHYSLRSPALQLEGRFKTQRVQKQSLRGWGPRYSSPMPSVAAKRRKLGGSTVIGHQVRYFNTVWVPQGSLTLSQRYSVGRRNDELTKVWSKYSGD